MSADTKKIRRPGATKSFKDLLFYASKIDKSGQRGAAIFARIMRDAHSRIDALEGRLRDETEQDTRWLEHDVSGPVDGHSLHLSGKSRS